MNAVSPAPLIMVMENDGDEGGSDSSPISPLSSSPISPLSKFTVQWSESIIESGFDNSRKIEEGCKNLIRTDSSDPSEVFACRLWFPSEKSTQPIALGPLKMATNLVTSYTDQGYKKSDVTQIFTSNALASMIEKRCFYFDTGQQVYISNSVEFTDESSFEASVKSGDSISIEAQVGYGPVAISAGYSQSSQVATTNSGNRKTAYGEKRYFKNIGVLDNLCLSANRVQDIKSLVKAEWVDKWSFIRNFQGSAEQLTKTQQFIDVAKAGLVIPKTYEYGAAISYEILSTYVYTSSESAEKMSQAISAGVSGSAGAGSASVSTNVEKTMETATKDTSLNAKTTVKLNVFGNNIDSACMKDDDCNKEMNEKVNEIVNDFNKAGYPLKPDITINLADFVTNFFNDGKPGFPDVFKQAIEMYYTIQRCVNPGGGYEGNGQQWWFAAGCNEFITKNGAGKKITPAGIATTYCPENTVCAYAQFFPYQVNEDEDRLCLPICTKGWKKESGPCINTENMINGC